MSAGIALERELIRPGGMGPVTFVLKVKKYGHRSNAIRVLLECLNDARNFGLVPIELGVDAYSERGDDHRPHRYCYCIHFNPLVLLLYEPTQAEEKIQPMFSFRSARPARGR